MSKIKILHYNKGKKKENIFKKLIINNQKLLLVEEALSLFITRAIFPSNKKRKSKFLIKINMKNGRFIK